MDAQTLQNIFVGNHGQPFRLNVWDFGGQQIYHATHQFFLTKNSLYLLVDDTRKDNKTIHDEGFKFWLEVVETLSEGSPLLIFQNEKGDRSKTIDQAGIQGRFTNVKAVDRGNLERPGSVKSLQQTIECFVQQLPHIGERVPKKWLAIRQELEQLAVAKPLISQDDYFAVYDRHLELDRTKALHLSRYLHGLGVVLHFQDDPLLSKTVILQNQWATEAVFRILDDESIKSQRGRFSAVDCQRLWAASAYADMHFELRGLMEKFELCYRLAAPHAEQWLAPQLLSPSKPAELASWARPDDLVVRFQYSFLELGLVVDEDRGRVPTAGRGDRVQVVDDVLIRRREADHVDKGAIVAEVGRGLDGVTAAGLGAVGDEDDAIPATGGFRRRVGRAHRVHKVAEVSEEPFREQAGAVPLVDDEHGPEHPSG